MTTIQQLPAADADKVRSLKAHAAHILGIETHEAANEFGSGDGDGGILNDRVTRLETHMEYVRKDLDRLLVSVDTIDKKLDALPTRKDLDGWRWQWIATGVGIIALTVGGITGGLALIAKIAG